MIGILLAVNSTPIFADALIQALPNDGEWVQFHVNLNVSGRESMPVWTVKSVGKKVVAGAAHRWIELQSKEGERNVVTFKCLIPEEEFGKGKNPLANALQVFVKFGDQEPREFESIAQADAPLAAILSGPAEAQKLDTKQAVELQSGRIECDVLTGTARSEIGPAKIELEFRLLMSDRVPHGLAGATFQIKADLAGNKLTGSADVALKETGKDAKSELPTIQ